MRKSSSCHQRLPPFLCLVLPCSQATAPVYCPHSSKEDRGPVCEGALGQAGVEVYVGLGGNRFKGSGDASAGCQVQEAMCVLHLLYPLMQHRNKRRQSAKFYPLRSTLC